MGDAYNVGARQGPSVATEIQELDRYKRELEKWKKDAEEQLAIREAAVRAAEENKFSQVGEEKVAMLDHVPSILLTM